MAEQTITLKELMNLVDEAIREENLSLSEESYYISEENQNPAHDEGKIRARLDKVVSFSEITLGFDPSEKVLSKSMLEQCALFSGSKTFKKEQDLNWQMAEQAALKPRKTALELFPAQDDESTNAIYAAIRNNILFNHLTGEALPEEIQAFDPYSVQISVLQKMMKLLTLRGPYATSDNIIPAINLVRLFNNMEMIDHFLSYGDSYRYRASLYTKAWVCLIHDRGQIPLPKEKISSEWGKFVMSFPSLMKYSAAFGRLEKLNNGKAPVTREEFNRVFEILKEEMKDKLVYLEMSIVGEQLEDYEALVLAGCKSHSNIPQVNVSIRKYKIETLAHDDIRQAMAGLYSDCCQHLHAAAASISKIAYKEPECGIWAISKDDNLIGQAFVWKAKNGTDIVIDSVEAKAGANSKVLAELIQKAADMAIGQNGVERVLISGSSGFTGECMDSHMETTPTPNPHPSLGDFYTDTTKSAKVVAKKK